MKHYLLLLAIFVLVSCQHKKANLAGDAPVKMNDFIAAFKPLPLPYSVADTNINAFTDTTTISKAVLFQFVPDSVLDNVIDLDQYFKINPVGKIVKDKELYLLFNIKQAKITTQIIAVFNKENRFLAAKELLTNEEDAYNNTLSINKEPTFTVSRERLNTTTKIIQFTRVGWVYNSAGVFMVVVNDTNEDAKANSEILNPIDTLPKKNKLSGEYQRNAKNFISIRDGKDAKSYFFFIHFEKKEGACMGELKGTIKMTSDDVGIYNQSGDPCVIDFTFADNEINIKEKGSCGNRRGMDCFFEDSFSKKKESKKGRKRISE